MKKLMMTAILACFCFLALASIGLTYAESDGVRGGEAVAFPDPSSVSTLPSSLIIIGEEAFEGTSLQCVRLPSSLEVIEDRAFADIEPLESVYIPEETQFIGDGAFANDGHVVLMGESGSYAERWAQEHSFRFEIYCDLTANAGSLGAGAKQNGALIPCLFASALLWLLAELNRRKPILWGIGEGKTMRPQDRPELNPIDYSFP